MITAVVWRSVFNLSRTNASHTDTFSDILLVTFFYSTYTNAFINVTFFTFWRFKKILFECFFTSVIQRVIVTWEADVMLLTAVPADRPYTTVVCAFWPNSFLLSLKTTVCCCLVFYAAARRAQTVEASFVIVTLDIIPNLQWTAADNHIPLVIYCC